ncbi:hypothetical protein JCM24511_06131 [Saitozyma sp. JCM 24511]|nr:hypothetical protein JCM24511_06131 [Saitozyma sp. JCM 24511]
MPLHVSTASYSNAPVEAADLPKDAVTRPSRTPVPAVSPSPCPYSRVYSSSASSSISPISGPNFVLFLVLRLVFLVLLFVLLFISLIRILNPHNPASLQIHDHPHPRRGIAWAGAGAGISAAVRLGGAGLRDRQRVFSSANHNHVPLSSSPSFAVFPCFSFPFPVVSSHQLDSLLDRDCQSVCLGGRVMQGTTVHGLMPVPVLVLMPVPERLPKR